MTNSERKFTVEIVPKTNGHPWVEVTFLSTGQKWAPSFEDLGRIIQPIAECEEAKYPQQRGFKGWRMAAEFLAAICNPDANYEDLARKYKLPVRNGGITISANGAKLPASEFVLNDPQRRLPGIST